MIYTPTSFLQVSLEVFTDVVSHHEIRPPVFEIIGQSLPPYHHHHRIPEGEATIQDHQENTRDPSVLRVTVLWQTGTNSSYNNSSPSSISDVMSVQTQLREWVESGTVPDVVVIGKGRKGTFI